ncbi:proteinase inhibitor I4 serpin [Tritrichomonas foetus]|uniref:Proteinase inhibitor I4 serpin n=1 Tax=Tritrichomonas foetus TaxID=1144522 RepID=A0A1J4JYX0_9EUKA|nr:proteinase inhibitor I4 serpin [Tritrichomonas foetus]|eukprot:OHT03680.1 proteinase inhibitor I4 serpin [Tritrichomonas foetus]
MAELVKALNKFAYETLGRTDVSSPTENTIFSPYSAFACVSMSTPLFKDQTRTEILKSLQIDESLDDVQVLTELKKLIDGEKTERVASSNRIWANQNLDFAEETFKKNSDVLGISIEKTNFPQPGCDKINTEVKEVTRGMIDKLVEESDVPASTAIVLLNAVYFKSDWETKFDLEPQNDRLNFTDVTGTQHHVQMMRSMKRSIQFSQNADFLVASIPYTNKEYDFTIVLPIDKTQAGFEKLKGLTFDTLNTLLSQQTQQKCNLIIPKFKIEQKTFLNDVFDDLGMKKSFTGEAECTDPNVKYFVSSILQKAKIDVDENGTVAAAATGMMMRCMRMPLNPEPIHEVCADHPFIYLLRNSNTGAILFEGFVKLPK